MSPLRVGRRGGAGLRWWPIILFVLYLGYYWFSNQHEVPITGRSQLVDISREQESALGLQSYQQILSQERVVRSGPEVDAVREIFAEKIGLVQYAVEDEAELMSMMKHLTGLAFAAAPGAITDSKALVRYLIDDATRLRNAALPAQLVPGHVIDEDLMKETAKRIAHRRASAEGKEGLAAFLEKRKPEWNP